MEKVCKLLKLALILSFYQNYANIQRGLRLNFYQTITNKRQSLILEILEKSRLYNNKYSHEDYVRKN